MTDREKLVELLKSLPQVNHAQAAVEGLDYVFGCAADYLIANGVTVQRWIPVTERLPESDVFVLGCSEGVLVFFGFLKAKKWYDLVFECQVLGVTHWMPMPEPPRGE